MAEIISVVKQVSEIGVPIVLSVMVIYFLWSLITQAPKVVASYIESKKHQEEETKVFAIEQQKKYDELLTQHYKQLEIVVTVAQQGIEAQKRGNTVIEQNTLAFTTSQKVNEQMISSIIDLKETTVDMCCDIKTNSEVTNKAYTELIRVGEIVRK